MAAVPSIIGFGELPLMGSYCIYRVFYRFSPSPRFPRSISNSSMLVDLCFFDDANLFMWAVVMASLNEGMCIDLHLLRAWHLLLLFVSSSSLWTAQRLGFPPK